jgi:intein/homing endonuclease
MKMSNLCLDIDSSYINSVQVNGNLYEKLLLSEVIDLFNDGNQIKVLSKNMETNELEFKDVEKAWVTKENAEVLEIEDIESGYKIMCTEDHLIFTKNRGWVEAGNLLENDILDII